MKKHILVIDGEEGMRDVLSQLFDSEGFQVTTASSGEEALRYFKSHPAQLVISDLQMEDTDGLELIEKIKEISPNVPIILLTGMVFDPDVIRETIHKKVSCYIEKSSPLKKLMSEVNRLLQEPPTPLTTVP